MSITSGKWHARESYGDRGGKFLEVINDSGETVLDAEFGGYVFAREDDLRAFLAIPEMVSALQGIVRRVDAGKEIRIGEIKRVREALEKATGRSEQRDG